MGYRNWNVNRTYLNLLSSYCIPIRRSNWCFFNAATTAIALPVSQGIGGVKELTSLAVILNAVVISALGTKIVKWFKISNPIARGLALGTSGHTLGVAAAKELGETEESMGSIAVVIVGVIIVAIVPPLASILF